MVRKLDNFPERGVVAIEGNIYWTNFGFAGAATLSDAQWDRVGDLLAPILNELERAAGTGGGETVRPAVALADMITPVDGGARQQVTKSGPKGTGRHARRE